MDRATVDIYDQRGLEWAATHATAGTAGRGRGLRRPGGAGSGLRVDVGCGAGRYLPHLGAPVWPSMPRWPCSRPAETQVPDALYVQGDVEHLPFTRGSIDGAWSWMTHLHVPRDRLPVALWDLHRVLAVGSPFEIQLLEGDLRGRRPPRRRGRRSVLRRLGAPTGWSTWSPAPDSRSSRGIARRVR